MGRRMRGARALALAAGAAGAAGHGYVVSPPPRAAHLISGDVAGVVGSCAAGMCFWFSQSCTIGCPKCLGSDSGDGKCGKSQDGTVATLPDRARSWWYGAGPPNFGPPTHYQDCGVNPWCKPGAAPIMDPCGVAGGDVVPGKPNNGGVPPAGSKQGDKGSLLPELGSAETVWKVGSVAEIQWSLIANHGGGYQYRLCPKSETQTEDCFQRTPLEFYGDKQYIQFCYSDDLYKNGGPYTTTGPFKACNPANRTSIPSVTVNEGTVPSGSTWMRNPVPACRAQAGGAAGIKCGDHGGSAPDDYQFPPAQNEKGEYIQDLTRPGRLLGGFGASSCYVPPGCMMSHKKALDRMIAWNVVDKVQVPNVAPGEYVMSFRWDCEQTPQIWSTCSDITITA